MLNSSGDLPNLPLMSIKQLGHANLRSRMHKASVPAATVPLLPLYFIWYFQCSY